MDISLLLSLNKSDIKYKISNLVANTIYIIVCLFADTTVQTVQKLSPTPLLLDVLEVVSPQERFSILFRVFVY